MDGVSEAKQILSRLLPIASTLPRLDRRYLRKWGWVVERGREVEDGRLEYLRRLEEWARTGEMRAMSSCSPATS